MDELIKQAQEAIDNDDMATYESIQKQVREKYKSEEQSSN